MNIQCKRCGKIYYDFLKDANPPYIGDIVLSDCPYCGYLTMVYIGKHENKSIK